MKKKAMVIASAFLSLLTLAAFPQPARASELIMTSAMAAMFRQIRPF